MAVRETPRMSTSWLLDKTTRWPQQSPPPVCWGAWPQKCAFLPPNKSLPSPVSFSLKVFWTALQAMMTTREKGCAAWGMQIQLLFKPSHPQQQWHLYTVQWFQEFTVLDGGVWGAVSNNTYDTPLGRPFPPRGRKIQYDPEEQLVDCKHTESTESADCVSRTSSHMCNVQR